MCVRVCSDKKKGELFAFLSFQYMHVNTCYTYNELWSNYPIHNGTEERRDDSDTDEYDRCYELEERWKWEIILEQKDQEVSSE